MKSKLMIATAVIMFLMAGVGVSNAQDETTFQVPAAGNTYTVTYDLKGLECVKGVGAANECAVPNQSADEGGYPWTKVSCRTGDAMVSTFAWSLGTNQPMGIFEAPASLTTTPDLYKVNVRLGKTCMKKGQ